MVDALARHLTGGHEVAGSSEIDELCAAVRTGNCAEQTLDRLAEPTVRGLPPTPTRYRNRCRGVRALPTSCRVRRMRWS